MLYNNIVGLLAVIAPGRAFIVPSIRIADGTKLHMSTSTGAASGAERNQVKNSDFQVVDPL